MKLVVYGPILPMALSDKGAFVVHEADCADLLRPPYPDLGADQGGAPVEEYRSVAELVEGVYPASCFGYDPSDPKAFESYRSDIYLFPCCANLLGYIPAGDTTEVNKP